MISGLIKQEVNIVLGKQYFAQSKCWLVHILSKLAFAIILYIHRFGFHKITLIPKSHWLHLCPRATSLVSHHVWFCSGFNLLIEEEELGPKFMLLDVAEQSNLLAVSQTSIVSLLLSTKAERGKKEKQHVSQSKNYSLGTGEMAQSVFCVNMRVQVRIPSTTWLHENWT